MRKALGLLVCLLFVMICAVAFAEVKINKKNFPDSNFREFIKTVIDTDKNGTLSDDEIANVSQIDVSNQEIVSLVGVEYFTNLSDLNCHDNQMTSLDVSMCTELRKISVQNNMLTTLDVSNQINLISLDCSCNPLTSLNVNGCAALTVLSCLGGKLSSLDIGGCTELSSLSCGNNQLTTLDIRKNPKLKDLRCYANELTALDLSECTALVELYCEHNQLISLDVSNCVNLKKIYCDSNQLTSLDVSKCTSLMELGCQGNQLGSLNVNGCIQLVILSCYDNQLISLNVSGCVQLDTLDCDKNMLTALIVNGCTDLYSLSCSNNQLKTFDASKCNKLMRIKCYNNQMIALDISGCTELSDLRCYNNQLVSIDLSECPKLKSLVEAGEPYDEGEFYAWFDYPSARLTTDKKTNIYTLAGAPYKVKDCTISLIPDQIYTGETVIPDVTVKYKKKELAKDIDYTLSYKNNKAIGTATVTVTGKGNYKGTQTASFKILPIGVKITSIKAGQKSLTVKWKKGDNISGYEIEYGLKENLKGAKKLTVSKAKNTSAVLEGLKPNKMYYVRIRTYKDVKGKKYYSDWSEALGKETK